jgi:hypothetical protein
MSNTSSSNVKFNKDNIPITNKKGHGIGIMSILAFAKKYDSIIDFSQKENVFNFKLIVNLE